MKLPESIETDDPREAIGFCIAYGIEEGILPPKFKMSQEGYDILTSAVEHIWDKGADTLNEIIIAFVAGFAAGSKQVTYKE